MPDIIVTSAKKINQSVPLDRELHVRFRKRVPRFGDRSKVVRELIKMFLDGKITVTIPARTV